MSRLKPKPAIWSSEANPRLGKPSAPQLTASEERIKHVHRFHNSIQKATPNKAGQLLSDLTHYSPTDPDARIAFKTATADRGKASPVSVYGQHKRRCRRFGSPISM
jgi:hypothetical protein